MLGPFDMGVALLKFQRAGFHAKAAYRPLAAVVSLESVVYRLQAQALGSCSSQVDSCVYGSIPSQEGIMWAIQAPASGILPAPGTDLLSPANFGKVILSTALQSFFF